MHSFTGDSLADRCLGRLWLQTGVCFPSGKLRGVGTLRKSLSLGAGGAALCQGSSRVTAGCPAFPQPGPGPVAVGPVCSRSAAGPCSHVQPQPVEEALPSKVLRSRGTATHREGGVGEPSPWTWESEGFEVLQQAGVRCLV